MRCTSDTTESPRKHLRKKTKIITGTSSVRRVSAEQRLTSTGFHSFRRKRVSCRVLLGETGIIVLAKREGRGKEPWRPCPCPLNTTSRTPFPCAFSCLTRFDVCTFNKSLTGVGRPLLDNRNVTCIRKHGEKGISSLRVSTGYHPRGPP